MKGKCELQKGRPTRREVDERVRAVSQEEVSRARFDGKVTIGEIKDPRLKAYTHMETRRIDLLYSPDYADENPSRVYAFARDVTNHEINHHGHKGYVRGYRFKGCPRNLDLSTRLIFEPIVEVLTEKGFSLEDAHYLENALEDDILHSDLSPAFDLSGISYFFEEVGRSTPNRKFTPFYESHVRTNLMLWGSKSQLIRSKEFFTEDNETKERIKKAIDEFTEKSGLADLRVSLSTAKSPAVLQERLRVRSYLNDEGNWPKIARAYAEAFSSLMTPSYAMALPNHSGSGTKGRESQDSSKEGNEFQKQRKNREYKRGRIESVYKSGSNPPKWIDSFEAMDLLYEGLARKLAFDVKTFTESSTMPVLRFGERAYRPGVDSLSDITFGFDERAKLAIRKRPFSIDMTYPIKQSSIGFPKARLVFLDTSGSMARDFNGGKEIGSTNLVPWGDRSKYHGALVEWYGFLEWLKENHILERTGISLVNFSGKTLVGEGLEEAKKQALTPQFGVTKLDSSQIGKVFGGKGMFISTISDGSIDNWRMVSSQFLKGVSENYYVHLQLGKENGMCQDIRQAGGHVEVIKTADDLRGRTIKLADKFYRGSKNE